MATWNIKCQTCRKSGCLGYGICFACNESECNYEPQPSSTTTSTNNEEIVITLSNTTTYDKRSRTMYTTSDEIKE